MIERRDPQRTPASALPRFMVLDWAFRLPWVSAFMRRIGGVVASPYNAIRLLEQGHLVMVFPEGTKGAGKDVLRALPAAALRARRLRRTGAAHRRADRAGRGRRVGRRSIPSWASRACWRGSPGAPYFPLTPTFPWLGPAGADPAAVEVADRVLRARRPVAVRTGGRRGPRTRVRAVRAYPRHDPGGGPQNLVARGSAFPLGSNAPKPYMFRPARSRGSTKRGEERSMRYFVTGATGFIGRHLVERTAEARGHDLRARFARGRGHGSRSCCRHGTPHRAASSR